MATQLGLTAPGRQGQGRGQEAVRHLLLPLPMATRPSSTSGQSEGGDFTCRLLPPRPLSLLLQEHRYPHSRRPADTHGDVQRAEQHCLATQLGWAGQEGVETELRQRLGRSNFSSPLGPRREASHLSLLQPTEQDSTCPRRDQYRLWLAWDPQPIAAVSQPQVGHLLHVTTASSPAHRQATD